MKVYFHEEQYFRRSWLWVSLLAVLLVVPIVTVAGGRDDAVAAIAIVLVVTALIGGIFAFAHLETEVRSDAVIVAFHGLWPTRRIALADVADVEARPYSILESGGWGVHLTFSGMAYNVSGNEGAFVRLRDGRRVLIGSQCAAELADAIRRARAEMHT